MWDEDGIQQCVSSFHSDGRGNKSVDEALSHCSVMFVYDTEQQILHQNLSWEPRANPTASLSSQSPIHGGFK